MRSMLHSAALIDAWFDTLSPSQREVGEPLRDAVVAADPNLELSIKWGNLVFSHRRRHALAIVAHRDHVNLQVFNGVLLAAQYPMLEGTGKDVRNLKLRLRQPVDAELVRALVHACVDEMQP